jgi:hypothetical protein
MNRMHGIIIITGLMIVYGFTAKDNPGGKDPDNKPLVIKSSPASNFIEVNLKDDYIPVLHSDSLYQINIRIINQKGIGVYSGVKTSCPFKVYVGGLPDGQYLLTLKVKQLEASDTFDVRH